jgi:6-phosphogluconate dehydrogenase
MNNSFAIIGLGTMGRNFLLNLAEHDFQVIGYDIDQSKRELLLKTSNNGRISAADSLQDLVKSMARPRKIMLLVPAGKVVDQVINDLAGLLEPEDLIIDGGNSHFTDTERRIDELAKKGITFLGVGISGGEEGARHGASIMAGGEPSDYEIVRPFFEAASAKVNGEPCAANVGRRSAGHFVKMVHNGIEYGLMQLIAEAYDLLVRTYELEQDEIAELFAEWNKGELSSFLIEITSIVLKKKDEETGEPLVEKILDQAGQKGTGKWTSQAAMDLGIPIPTIDSAVTMRQISSLKNLRNSIAECYKADLTTHHTELREEELEKALLAAFYLTFAQGFSLLVEASKNFGYELNPARIARIWRGGCIIRAKILDIINAAFTNQPDLESILTSPDIIKIISENSFSLRRALSAFNGHGIPAMCFGASLDYFDAMRSKRLTANLIQAQRDFFGAHTYQRIDKEGVFHTTDWKGEK